MPRFKQVTIVGLGLIGGSLGMAVRRQRLAREVIGLSRSRSTVRRAKQRGAIDEGTTDPRGAVRDAELVVIATPVDTIIPYAMRLARLMRPGSVLTDVGSTKAHIVEALERRLPGEIPFVGAHPLAGSERRGLTAASAQLFDGSICIVTPTARTDRRAVKTLRQFWSPLVRQVVTMRPRQHDRVLAGISHLPHLVAYSLVRSVNDAQPRPPQSFLDMTRIAQSDPALWDDIFLTNRAELLAALRRFERELHRVRACLARGRGASLHRWLAGAKAKRDALQGR